MEFVRRYPGFLEREQGIVKGTGPVVTAPFGLPPPYSQVMGFLGNIEQAEIAIKYPYYLANSIRIQAFDRFQQI